MKVCINVIENLFQPNFPFSTIKVSIYGEPFKMRNKIVYKSIMFSDLPNFAFTMEYTNASWTLKSDIACGYFCKLLNYMKDNDYALICPRISLMGWQPKKTLPDYHQDI